MRPRPDRSSRVRIGTRASRLALAQATEVKRRLERTHPNVRFTLVKIKTLGDEYQSVAFFKKTNVGVFTKAIEKKLLSGTIDLAVHSLKDLPTELPKGLELAAFPKRLRSGDVLITRKRLTLSQLPPGAIVGTGSPRRKRQIAAARPDLVLKDMRGNLDTRVSKVLREKTFDAIVIAEAGLERIGRYRRFARSIDAEVVLPAVGQAALGLQIRSGDPRLRGLLKKLNHSDTEKEVRAERSLLAKLGGGCRVPVGVLCRVTNGRIALRATVFSVKDHTSVSAHLSGRASLAEALGAKLASLLLKKGAARLMAEARSHER